MQQLQRRVAAGGVSLASIVTGTVGNVERQREQDGLRLGWTERVYSSVPFPPLIGGCVTRQQGPYSKALVSRQPSLDSS